MPRLFVASGIFHPDPGGPATYLTQLLPALQDRGWEIHVLSYGDAPSEPFSYPYPVKRIRREATPWRQMQYSLATHREIQNADVVFEQSIDLPIFREGVPRVLRLGGDSLWERARRRNWIPEHVGITEFQNYQNSSIVQAMRSFRRRKLKRYRAIIVPSKTLGNYVCNWGASSDLVRVIENAVHTDSNVSTISKSEAKKRIDLPKGKLILTVARLQLWKGIGPSIRALAQLPDCSLIIAGDGPLLGLLKQEAIQHGVSDRVHFLGRLDAKTLALYYRTADIVLLYSGYEGLSHVLLEALGYGTPVLVSDIPGNREVVKDGVNGWLIPYVTDETEASASIVKAIQFACTSEPGTNHIKGFLLEPDRFSFSRQVEQTDAVLRAQLP